MSSRYEKHFIFFAFLSLLTVFSQTAAAQDANPFSLSSFETQSETAEIEREELVLCCRLEDSAARQNDFQIVHAFGNSVSGREKNEPAAEVKPLHREPFDKTKIKSVGDDFRSADRREQSVRFGSSTDDDERFSFRPERVVIDAPDDANDLKADDSFRWLSATKQTLMFLAIQHGYAFTQPKTREAIKGKFWKDYAKSVKSLHGWDDGGRFFTNYIAHPMQGAFLGFLQVQNDPKGLNEQFGASKEYWNSRLKAAAWSAAWSTQFEIGPISQASIGNVGLKGKQTWEDIIVTPTLGTAMLIGEDAIDRFVTKRIERSSDNFYVKIFSRMLLSPTRTVANVFRFKAPWYRDRPTAR